MVKWALGVVGLVVVVVVASILIFDLVYRPLMIHFYRKGKS